MVNRIMGTMVIRGKLSWMSLNSNVTKNLLTFNTYAILLAMKRQLFQIRLQVQVIESYGDLFQINRSICALSFLARQQNRIIRSFPLIKDVGINIKFANFDRLYKYITDYHKIKSETNVIADIEKNKCSKQIMFIIFIFIMNNNICSNEF